MRVTDYTAMSLGTKIENGEIKKCPHCGNNGLAEEANGKTFYTHSQTVGWSESNQPVIDWKWCPHS
jgi:hypothetical protein